MGTSALRLYCRIAAANLEHRLPALARRRKFALTTKIGVDMHWSEFGSSSQDQLQHSVVRSLLHQHGQVPLLVAVVRVWWRSGGGRLNGTCERSRIHILFNF